MKNQIISLIKEEFVFSCDVHFYENDSKDYIDLSDMLEKYDCDDIDELFSNRYLTIIDYDLCEDYEDKEVHVYYNMFYLSDLENNGLVVAQTTEGMNGYPKDLTDVLIGFSSWKELEELTEKYPFLQVVELTRKDGQSFWKNTGEIYECFSAQRQYDEKGNCNWTEFEPESDLQVLQEALSTFSLSDIVNDADKYKDMIETFVQNCDDYEDLDEDELLIVDSYGINEILKPCMEFYEDVTTHTIGLIIKD